MGDGVLVYMSWNLELIEGKIRESVINKRRDTTFYELYGLKAEENSGELSTRNGNGIS